jgi:hypothetical protein
MWTTDLVVALMDKQPSCNIADHQSNKENNNAKNPSQKCCQSWLVGWLVGCHFGRLILDANHHSSFSLTKMFPCPSTPGSNKSWQESTADKEQALLSPVSEMKSTTTGHFGCHCIPSWSSCCWSAARSKQERTGQ